GRPAPSREGERLQRLAGPGWSVEGHRTGDRVNLVNQSPARRGGPGGRPVCVRGREVSEVKHAENSEAGDSSVPGPLLTSAGPGGPGRGAGPGAAGRGGPGA